MAHADELLAGEAHVRLLSVLDEVLCGADLKALRSLRGRGRIEGCEALALQYRGEGVAAVVCGIARALGAQLPLGRLRRVRRIPRIEDRCHRPDRAKRRAPLEP